MLRHRVCVLIVLSFSFTLGRSGWTQNPEPNHSIVLHAARLLDVANGKILKPGEVLVQGERIVEVGTAVKHPAGAEIIDLGDRTLLPGLIDAHIHLFLHPGQEDLQTVLESVPQRTIMATLGARDDLMAGFTAERDMGTEGAGSADTAVRDAIDRGDIPGPRLRISGNAINTLGGHEDAIGYNPAQHVLPNADYANNAEQLVEVIREQFKQGARSTTGISQLLISTAKPSLLRRCARRLVWASAWQCMRPGSRGLYMQRRRESSLLTTHISSAMKPCG